MFDLISMRRSADSANPMITHALQVARDLDGADNVPQIARERLLKREERDRGLLDLDLQRIDGAIAGDDRVCLVRVALEQRLDRDVD